MRVLIVKSSENELPLAEVREAGGIIDFIVDNTEGMLPKKVGKSYQALLDFIKHSSRFTLEEPKEPTASLLRYILNNGDVVEITTDGKTAMLNGKLMSEEEKQALFEAIRNKQISISRKADPSSPVPVMPTPKIKQVPIAKVGTTMDKTKLKAIADMETKKSKSAQNDDSDYDNQIEKMDLRGAEDPQFV